MMNHRPFELLKHACVVEQIHRVIEAAGGSVKDGRGGGMCLLWPRDDFKAFRTNNPWRFREYVADAFLSLNKNANSPHVFYINPVSIHSIHSFLFSPPFTPINLNCIWSVSAPSSFRGSSSPFLIAFHNIYHRQHCPNLIQVSRCT